MKKGKVFLEQLRVIISKPWNEENEKLNRSIRKIFYDSKLLLYPKLQNEMSDLLKQTFEELSNITQYVNKLDIMSLNVIKTPSAGVGPTLLQDYLKQLI